MIVPYLSFRAKTRNPGDLPKNSWIPDQVRDDTERVNYFVTPVLGGPPPQGEILRSLTFVRDDTAV